MGRWSRRGTPLRRIIHANAARPLLNQVVLLRRGVRRLAMSMIVSLCDYRRPAVSGSSRRAFVQFPDDTSRACDERSCFQFPKVASQFTQQCFAVKYAITKKVFTEIARLRFRDDSVLRLELSLEPAIDFGIMPNIEHLISHSTPPFQPAS